MNAKPTIEIGQTVHYHASWRRPFETNVYYAKIDADDYAVILPVEATWVCGVTDGTMCVEDIAENRDTTENFVLQGGHLAIAVNPDNQPVCDKWAELHADCWGK